MRLHAGPFVTSWMSYFALLLLHTHFLCSDVVSGQLLKNGQVFTEGLAIVDAPNPGSQFTAGQNLPIAIDLSGDGKLSQEAFLPNSTLDTMYQSLNLFLISSQTNTNVTVSEGPQYLTQEAGSTVKHLTYVIPSCVSAGPYNLTVYEMSRINSTEYYSITPIPIIIISNSPKSTCDNNITNPVQAQPQISTPPPSQPWLGNYPITQVITVTSTVTESETISGFATAMTTLSTFLATSTFSPVATGALLPVNNAIETGHVNWPVTLGLGLLLVVSQFT